MKYNSIKSLKDIHKDSDIWILLAGSSMNFIDRSFFDNKITIGQNQMYKHYPCSYIVMKDCMEEPRFPRSIKECEDLNIPLIFSKYYKGHPEQGYNTPDHSNSYVFNHNKRIQDLDIEILNILDDEIIVSKSTATSLMHIAAYMGAKNIILCGHDCGTIDGKLYFDNYVESDWVSSGNWNGIIPWMASVEGQSSIVKSFLIKKYNCNIYSLNPFLNLGLENHKFIKI